MEPTFIHRDGMITDAAYVQWLSDIKTRFQQSQIKAAVRVNCAMLEFYWSLGRDIVAMKAESKWGSGFFNQLSLDVKAMFPGQTGFSTRTLRYIKQWYLFYYKDVAKLHQVGAVITGSSAIIDENEILHQDGAELLDSCQRPVDELRMPLVFSLVPWRHHVAIFTKCTSVDEALFYINKAGCEGWSRSRLEANLDSHAFEAQGKAITNFDRTLPSPQGQIAQEILKSPYNLEFLAMRQGYEEKELEEALVSNVIQFLLELGKGFAYVGRQMELRIDEESVFFPDLVFYHIPQKRYVIIELKAVKFTPEFAGKLNFYVTAADKLLRGTDDNSSVGLLICKTAKKTIVEWSLQDIGKPLGVATYQLQEVVDRTVMEIEQKKRM